jgi:D-beta-D-heptose 7-phosphate kinase/D-beta-D-heptose 1-phosphate adenosyltransferase
MSAQLDMIFSFPKARIAVLGDVMLDRFVFGEVDRISPEAPIPVIRVAREESMLGGAGNVAANIVHMGGQATLIAALGADAAAASVLAAAAREQGLSTSLIQDGEVQTIIKTRFISQGQQLLRVDEERPREVTGVPAEKLAAALEAALPQSNVLICSDYAKGVLTKEMLGRAILMARAAGVMVIVDPKGRDFSRYAGATIITPNAREAAHATGIPCDTDDNVARAAQAITEVVGCNTVLVTRGAQGMTLLSRQDGSASTVHLPTETRAVHDVSGAGDTVVAALALALAVGTTVTDAALLANLAAGIAVGKVGTAPVEAAELARAIQVSDFLAANAKTVDLDAAAAIARSWRLQGQRVVFTNGCFDLLHPGHVHLLERARAEGDKLIVALNSDESVRRLKGPTRPLQNQAARATVMASVGVVDLVTIFTEETPVRAIEAIQPDVLVKGADYAESQVVGGDLVRGRGGRVVLVPLESGHSTTSTVQRAAAGETET